MKSQIELGAWIVAIYKTLSQYPLDDPSLDPLDSIINLGRAADFFSSTRSLGIIDSDKFEIYRKLSKLRPLVAKEVLLNAEKMGFIDIDWEYDEFKIKKYRFLSDTKEGVFEAVGSIFLKLNPTDCAKAIIKIMQLTTLGPIRLDQVESELSKYFKEEVIEQSISIVTALGLVNETSETESGSNLLFNPNIFQDNAYDVYKVIQNLSPSDRQMAQDILFFVQENPGVPLPSNFDARVQHVLIKIGLIDYSKIVTRSNQKGRYFPTSPQIWDLFTSTPNSKFSKDLIDDSKLFLNSLRYGQYFSQPDRGKIKNPILIVSALLRDGSIGNIKPARAIGEDYPLALSRGIVNVIESRMYPGRYSMELLKVDVAKSVHEVLKQKAILPEEKVFRDQDIESAGKFISPSAIRVEKELPAKLIKCHDELVFGLRTMKRRS